MLRRATLPLRQLRQIRRSSDVDGRTGTFPAGLWEWRAGRPYGLLDASTPVGCEQSL